MNLDIEILAEDAMREDGVDRKKVMAILAKGLRNKMPEIDVYEEVYREVYGDELTPEKCEELIACLHQGEEHGRLVIQMVWLLSWIFGLMKHPLRQRCSVLLSIFSIMIALFL